MFPLVMVVLSGASLMSVTVLVGETSVGNEIMCSEWQGTYTLLVSGRRKA